MTKQAKDGCVTSCAVVWAANSHDMFVFRRCVTHCRDDLGTVPIRPCTSWQVSEDTSERRDWGISKVDFTHVSVSSSLLIWSA